MIGRNRRRSGDVYADLRYPPGAASMDAAIKEAQKWGEQFPGAHVRLTIGDQAVIELWFPRRRRKKRREGS